MPRVIKLNLQPPPTTIILSAIFVLGYMCKESRDGKAQKQDGKTERDGESGKRRRKVWGRNMVLFRSARAVVVVKCFCGFGTGLCRHSPTSLLVNSTLPRERERESVWRRDEMGTKSLGEMPRRRLAECAT